MLTRVGGGLIILFTLSLLIAIGYVALWHIRYYPDLFLGGGPEIEGAKVYVDGEFLGVVKDRQLWSRVGSGKHKLKVVKAGYKPYEKEIYVVGGEGYFTISLEPIKSRAGQSHDNHLSR